MNKKVRERWLKKRKTAPIMTVWLTDCLSDWLTARPPLWLTDRQSDRQKEREDTHLEMKWFSSSPVRLMHSSPFRMSSSIGFIPTYSVCACERVCACVCVCVWRLDLQQAASKTLFSHHPRIHAVSLCQHAFFRDLFYFANVRNRGHLKACTTLTYSYK